MIEENVFGGNDMRYETYSGQYKILETETIYLIRMINWKSIFLQMIS